MKALAIIDFETTGLRAGEDRIIEVAAILVHDGVVVATFAELMDPGCAIPPFITHLTGISQSMLRGKPPPEAVMPRLRAFLGDHVCLAHNAAFDQRFFTAEMDRAEQTHERTFLCSLLLARRLLSAPNHRLGTLVHHLGLTPPAGMKAHRALADVLMTCALWNHLHRLLRDRLALASVDAAIIHAVMRTPKAAIPRFLASIAERTGNRRHPGLTSPLR